jgi:hypothetical protein
VLDRVEVRAHEGLRIHAARLDFARNLAHGLPCVSVACHPRYFKADPWRA